MRKVLAGRVQGCRWVQQACMGGAALRRAGAGLSKARSRHHPGTTALCSERSTASPPKHHQLAPTKPQLILRAPRPPGPLSLPAAHPCAHATAAFAPRCRQPERGGSVAAGLAAALIPMSFPGGPGEWDVCLPVLHSLSSEVYSPGVAKARAA